MHKMHKMNNPPAVEASTTRERCIALALTGMRPSEIAIAVNRQPNTVSGYLFEARQAGMHIPKFTSCQGKPVHTVVALPPDTVAALRIHAHRRGLTVRELVLALTARIGAEGLVSAVLDDGGKANG